MNSTGNVKTQPYFRMSEKAQECASLEDNVWLEDGVGKGDV